MMIAPIFVGEGILALFALWVFCWIWSRFDRLILGVLVIVLLFMGQWG